MAEKIAALAFVFVLQGEVPSRWRLIYVRQWIDDFRVGRAGGRTREQIEDTGFRRWLMERGYAQDIELATLDDWLNSRPLGIQFQIRPSVQVLI
jgi:O-acetyl-ADP-ribose deacetylase